MICVQCVISGRAVCRRFMNESQSSQLSAWMKPSVRKFQQFALALAGFRTFVTHAMHDKSLLLVSEMSSLVFLIGALD